MLAVACWLPSSTCWLPSPAYWLLPVGFHIYLACLFSLSPAGCRLLASASHLLTCACWLPAPAYCLLPVGFHLQPFHCVLELVIGFSVFTHSCSYVQVAHCFGGFAPEQKVDKKLERHELLSTWPYMFDRLAARSIFSSTGSLIARSVTKDSDHEGACNSSWLTRRSRASSTTSRRPPPRH